MRSVGGAGCKRWAAPGRPGTRALAVGPPPALRSLPEPDVNDDAYPGLDVDDPWQAVEACFAQGWTDGLPVVPPTAALVERMLAGGPWRAPPVLRPEPVGDPAVTAGDAADQRGRAGRPP